MKDYPQSEKESINLLLHKFIGSESNEFKPRDLEQSYIFFGEKFIQKNKEETLALINNLDNENYIKLAKVLYFYHPYWISFNLLKESDDAFKENSQNNILLLALTSIIDFLNKDKIYKQCFIEFFKKRKNNYTQKYVYFLENNLNSGDLLNLSTFNVKEKGKNINIKNINKMARYLYKIRSQIIHKADVIGLYPWNLDFDIYENKNTGEILPKNMKMMKEPIFFRKYLWRAILNSLTLNKVFEDGDTIEVDADKGIVKKIK